MDGIICTIISAGIIILIQIRYHRNPHHLRYHSDYCPLDYAIDTGRSISLSTLLATLLELQYAFHRHYHDHNIIISIIAIISYAD